MKKKFSTVISPFDIEQKMNYSNNASNTICNNNTSFFNKRNLSHNFDDTIFNEVSELILKANQEIKENKALNTESNLPSQRSYKPSKAVSSSPKKKKPIKLLLGNNVLKKSTEESPMKPDRMIKKKSSRNIAIPDISPIQISNNTSHCGTYNYSISKSKKKPISSSIKMTSMTHRSQNSTILNGSFVINSMKKSLYKKYNTNTQQNSVLRNSSNKKNNISNVHKNIISTFNYQKNEHNKTYLTNNHNSKNKNNNLFINHHKNKTSIVNKKPKEKIINFDKSISYKNRSIIIKTINNGIFLQFTERNTLKTAKINISTTFYTIRINWSRRGISNSHSIHKRQDNCHNQRCNEQKDHCKNRNRLKCFIFFHLMHKFIRHILFSLCKFFHILV